MLRKFISGLLTITFLLSSITVFAQNNDVTTETTEPILTEKQTYAVDLMKSIGIYDDNFDLSTNITRAEMAKALYVLHKGTDLGKTAANVYADIDTDEEYITEISYAYNMNFMTGYLGLWRPDDFATVGEIAVSLVKVLGLDFVVNPQSEYPEEYMKIANSFGIFEGVTRGISDNVTVAEAALIFENFLNAKINDKQETTYGIAGYYMTAVHNISSAKGVLMSNGITSLIDNDEKEGKAFINGVEYNLNGVDCEKYLGKKVQVYYQEGEYGELNLLTIREIGNGKVLHINSENIEDYKNREYTYTISDQRKKKTAELTATYNIVYNGRLVTDGTLLTPDMMTPDEGYVELIDNDNDNKYETLVIVDCITFVVDEYNADTMELKSLNGVPTVEFDRATIKCELYMSDGKTEVEIDYRNIAHNGYVLSLTKSLDNKVIKIYLAQQTINGTIESIDRDEKEIVVNGTQYILSRNFDAKWSVGASAMFYFNEYGHIIYAEREAGVSTKYAYLVSARFAEEDNVVIVKLYSEDNIYVTANTSKNIRVDGIRYSDLEPLATEISSHANKLVRYRMDSEGKIKWIDTDYTNLVNEKSDDALNVVYENYEATSGIASGYDKWSRAFGELYMSVAPTSKDTLVFYTLKQYEEDMIYCYPIDAFASSYANNNETEIGDVILYNTDNNSMVGSAAVVYADVIGTKSGRRGSNLRNGAVVTKIAHSINDVGDLGHTLTVEMNGNSEEIFIEEDAIKFTTGGKYVFGADNQFTLEIGDVISWGVDIYGKIRPGNVFVIYDWSENTLGNSENATSRYRYDHVWHSLWLLDKEDKWLKTVNQAVSDINKFKNGEIEESKLWTYVENQEPKSDGSLPNIYVFDKEAKSLRKSDAGEFNTYRAYGLNCTAMVGRYDSSAGRHNILIVYR